jgi:hyaluronoglucosaminidase
VKKNDSAFRGVIEGFYGPLWTHENRLHLLTNMPRWAMNLYIYAPKNDPHHRFRWEVPYPAAEMRRFRELADVAKRHRVQFSIAISPGNTFRPEDNRHQRQLMRKLGQFIDVGCEFFPILYDDLHGFSTFDTPQAAEHARRQAGMMNAYVERIARLVPRAKFLFCPTEYGTAEKSAYLATLHEALDPRVEVVCTGVDGPGYQVFSKTFSNAGAEKYLRNFGRKPFFWDNFNTSDFTLNELHWSPYQGRGDRLQELCSGIVLNPQNVYRLNLPIFGTMGEYFKNPRHYEAAAAMKKHLAALLGEPGRELGMILSTWFTNEISGYMSSAQNLPPISETLRPATRRAIRAAVRSLLRLRDAVDFAPLPPEWAGELVGYCHLLGWWANAVTSLCDAGRATIPETAIQPPRGYGYSLPGSLLDYLQKLSNAARRSR